jgi:glutamate carboxypeptidase
MDPVLACLKARTPELTGFLRELVECESPSGDSGAVNRCVDLFSSRVADIAKCSPLPGGRFGKNLLVTFNLPGPRKKLPGRIFAVGHSDTVWPVGTLSHMPWRDENGRLWGPGIFDMKAGLVFFVEAMRALRALDIPVRREVALWIVSDEEIGSEVSRPITESLARESAAVLIPEPAAGLDGKLKTARKGVGDYTLKVRGIASHSGLDFTAGASAIVELAAQIGRVAAFTDLKKGLTVNPGIITGGTRSNVVAAEAECEVDIRVARARDFPALDKKFRQLKPIDKRCSLEVSGGLNRPPLERSAGVRALFRTASALASSHLGVKLGETAVGGGSDGNFTAGLGIPTLDGLGAIGEGAHAPHESILKDRIADRAALLALLTAHLADSFAPDSSGTMGT